MVADPYKVLGVPSSASDDEIKKAYRQLSKKYHPDDNPDDPEAAEEKFKEVQEAYRQIVDAKEKGTSPYGSPYGQSASSGQGSSSYGGRGYADYGGYWAASATSSISGRDIRSSRGPARQRMRRVKCRQPATTSTTAIISRL